MNFKALFKLTLICILFLGLNACKKEKKPTENPIETPVEVEYKIAESYSLKNISYGPDSQQKIDIYLPANRDSSTKVFVLIHGGGWTSGSKSDYEYLFNTLKTYYPTYAIVNIGYRLATIQSPGYPKQINDISAALQHVQLAKYNLSNQYCIFGSSAGGHLAMLYGYAFDPNNTVKVICNTVGPADFTDSSYTQNSQFEYGLTSLVGPYTYQQNPGIYAEVSPALHVKTNSPKTISFYGDADPLIPATQINRLHNQLNAKGVINEATLYPGEGHGNWSQANNNDYTQKTLAFIQQHF